jgi:hypothetical protein
MNYVSNFKLAFEDIRINQPFLRNIRSDEKTIAPPKYKGVVSNILD